jgi:hypothetical protein
MDKTQQIVRPRHKYFMFFCVMEGDRGSEEIAREMEIGKEMEMAREMEMEREM